MQQRTKSLIFIIIGLIGFLGFTSFSRPSSDLVEACKKAVQPDLTISVDDRLLRQCEKDKGFAIMMTSDSINPQAIVSSNRYEVLFNVLRWFFLGIGIAGVLTLFIKKKQ